ncbi:uncharacterized protein LOC128416602 [Podarcis raffonei]|uniref:uncharacterized protein LOC128416602 n=1 Tax=Podarcis raffonei TaxID=65483 RepID=UPI0023297CA6|nr:uncharacterized protein LOC128416602 [Podarcis raffonei]
MAPPLEEAGAGGFFPSFLVVSLVGLTACLLALCALCRRKEKNRVIPQDGAMLEEATELLTVLNSHQLNRTNSKAKNLRSASGNIPYALSEDDGTISSCSFIILPQRRLPRTPPVDLVSPDQTYSNLSFQNRAEDVLYESMSVSEEATEEPSPVTKEEEEDSMGQEDPATGPEYACVLKGKKMKAHQRTGMEAGASEASQQGSLATTLHTAQAVQLEEMYSVVRKERKKEEKKKTKGSGGHSGDRPSQEEMSPGNALVASVHQESDGRGAGHPPSLFQPPAIEPCYESVGCESWVGNGRKPSTEPAYEAVDTYWKNSRRKRKADRNAPAENLYESIENLAFQFQNQNMLAHFEI